MTDSSVPESIVQSARAAADGYSNGENRPLGGYVLLLTSYATIGLGTLTTVAVRKRHASISAADIGLVAVATHKLARILTKSAVTSPIRAPFTRYAGVTGPAELGEEVRHEHGLRHAVGELLTCPFCVSQWIATGFTTGLLLAPRPTRAVASVFAAVAVSDFLQLGYAIAEQKAE